MRPAGRGVVRTDLHTHAAPGVDGVRAVRTGLYPDATCTVFGIRTHRQRGGSGTPEIG
jgi:hypothetical protein